MFDSCPTPHTLSHDTPQNLHARYPGTDDTGLDMLRAMLRFDPSQRLTVAQALAHPYLASVRNESKETVASTPMSDTIESVGEDQDHLHANVSREVALFCGYIVVTIILSLPTSYLSRESQMWQCI